MKLTKNFVLSEFNCHDDTQVPDKLIPNVQQLANNLQVIRDEIKQPLQILSGYRTPTWNKKVGGVSNSMHLKGFAADLTTKTLTPKQLHSVILNLIKEGRISEGGVGLYPGFVHYDCRKVKARW